MLRDCERRIGGDAIEIARVFEIEELEIRQRPSRERGLADLPRAEKRDRGKLAEQRSQARAKDPGRGRTMDVKTRR